MMILVPLSKLKPMLYIIDPLNSYMTGITRLKDKL